MIGDDPGILIDVGADHGHVAAAVGAVATERMPGRTGRSDVPWVIADGLAPFRHVDTAIIAGMGAKTILGILDRGPRPRRSVLVHAPDDPPALRVGLAARGWRIDAEALAPEARRHAEVIRAVPGPETATGAMLALGPRLLKGRDPHLKAHLVQLRGYFSTITRATAGRDPEKHLRFSERLSLVERVLSDRFGEAEQERSGDSE